VAAMQISRRVVAKRKFREVVDAAVRAVLRMRRRVSKKPV
jgi:hypothetical protein